MAQLWGGRFTKETDQLVYNFNASISFDKRFYEQDIRGSIAHVTMLAKQGILTEDEKKQIIDGLNGIREDVENGTLEITDKYEDIHSPPHNCAICLSPFLLYRICPLVYHTKVSNVYYKLAKYT